MQRSRRQPLAVAATNSANAAAPASTPWSSPLHASFRVAIAGSPYNSCSCRTFCHLLQYDPREDGPSLKAGSRGVFQPGILGVTGWMHTKGARRSSSAKCNPLNAACAAPAAPSKTRAKQLPRSMWELSCGSKVMRLFCNVSKAAQHRCALMHHSSRNHSNRSAKHTGESTGMAAVMHRDSGRIFSLCWPPIISGCE